MRRAFTSGATDHAWGGSDPREIPPFA